MMKASLVSASTPIDRPQRGNLLNRLVKQAIIGRLGSLQYGSLTLIDADDCRRFGRAQSGEPHLTLTIHDPAAWVDIAFSGGLGAGEAYMAGRWHCDDLTGLAQLFLRNPQVLYGLNRGPGRLVSLVNKVWHALRRNTLQGSRKNIAAHYDLGNELFELFLDDTMMYSCGIFEHPHASLQQASIEKLDRVCRKLELHTGDHLLEIGSGWGGLALHAARHYGCRVTTTTISREQYELARERVSQAGLDDRITVLYKDYRELSGQYDKLVSIEMIEAVGHAYFDTYFEKCSSLLKPDGLMLLQSITIAEQRYAAAKRSVDFIQRYIFPGGCLPSVAVISDAVARNTDMRLLHLEDIGPHYATTLKHWRERFMAKLDEVRALGYPEEFIRMWEYYLCYCEGGFRERAIGTAQVLMGKPLNRRKALLPILPMAEERAA
ncbi:MAG: cyclopropane-fatty-acyl-phospholipid synthase family protein [Gammaproteobacteria bacterium]